MSVVMLCTVLDAVTAALRHGTLPRIWDEASARQWGSS
jgi:hypothetical protein